MTALLELGASPEASGTSVALIGLGAVMFGLIIAMSVFCTRRTMRDPTVTIRKASLAVQLVPRNKSKLLPHLIRIGHIPIQQPEQ